MQISKELDTRGLNCPLPILKAKKALADMVSGETLKVVATDPGSVRDFQAFSTPDRQRTGRAAERRRHLHSRAAPPLKGWNPPTLAASRLRCPRGGAVGLGTARRPAGAPWVAGSGEVEALEELAQSGPEIGP